MRRAQPSDRAEWLRLRSRLWPDGAGDHPGEIDAQLRDASGRSVTFVVERPGRGGLSGFLELRLRDHADGCAGSPVAYVEGWYVDPDRRRRGLGGALLAEAERWARSRGLAELASDAELDNEVGRRAHVALGFEEVGRVVQLRKTLGAEPGPRAFPAVWTWLFPFVYGVHLLDERLYGIGTAAFATRYLGIYFTDDAWLAVNVPSFLALTVASALVARGRWPEWVVLALATHLALHSLGRVPGALWYRTMAPGLLSGLLLCLPLAAATFWRGRGIFDRREWRVGVLVGLASFQPFWHFALLPVLPSGPAGG